MPEIPIENGEVQVVRQGRVYRAAYALDQDDVVTLKSKLGVLVTQAGGSPPDFIARMLLREMVQ